MNTFPLEDKVFLITGGLGGIALGVARLALERGVRGVLLCDLREEGPGLEEARTEAVKGKATGKEDRVAYARCDVTDRKQFEACFARCQERFGSPPDVLINAAGVAGEQNWERLYDINVKGTHLGVELAFKHMSGDAGGNRVVLNLSSTAGITCIGDMFATPAYTASKHAVTAMTRAFGHDFHFRRHGVRVVALAPYFVQTPLVESEFGRFTADEEARAAIREGAVGREMLTVEETALKLVNVLGAKSGSVWMIRPEQMQPFNVPDYKLPHRMGYRSNDSYPKPKLYCGVPI